MQNESIPADSNKNSIRIYCLKKIWPHISLSCSLKIVSQLWISKLILTVQLIKLFNNQYRTFPVIIYLSYVKHYYELHNQCYSMGYAINTWSMLLGIYFTNMLSVWFLLNSPSDFNRVWYCQWCCWEWLTVGRYNFI